MVRTGLNRSSTVGYKRVPSQDEEEDDTEIELKVEKKEQKQQQQQAPESSKKLLSEPPPIKNHISILNESKPTAKKTVVHNPLFNIDEYVKEDMESKHRNTNNNNNNNTSCNTAAKRNGGDDNTNRNSFLNILTKTLRNFINQENSSKRRKDKLETTRVRYKEARKASSTNSCSNVRLNDIHIDLGDNNEREIELKVRIPRRCLTNTDLQILADKKPLNLGLSSLPAASTTELEEDGSSSSSNCGQKMVRIKEPSRCYQTTKVEKNDNDMSSLEDDDDERLAFYRHENKHVQISRTVSLKLRLTIALCIACLLLNPLFGIVSLVIALRSRRKDGGDESRLAASSRRISIAGILITLASLAALGLLMYTTDKSRFFKLVLLTTNSSTTSTSKSPKHKLHFWWSEQDETATRTMTSNGPRLTRNNNTTNMINRTITMLTTTKSDGGGKERKQSTRLYDRLSILIDHDLFMNLNFKYKIFNETLT